MIRIQRCPEPAKFITQVLTPGKAFLARYPRPTGEQFKHHNYWTRIHGDLYYFYQGVCSYCASWTPRRKADGGHDTSVDHFIPKRIAPELAYEWDNFRFCRARINTKKGDSLDVMDPVAIQDGWFVLDFETFLIVPSDQIPPYVAERVTATVTILGLNENDYVNERVEIVKLYIYDQFTKPDLLRRYPFIASEMDRVNFDLVYKNEFKRVFNR